MASITVTGAAGRQIQGMCKSLPLILQLGSCNMNHAI